MQGPITKGKKAVQKTIKLNRDHGGGGERGINLFFLMHIDHLS